VARNRLLWGSKSLALAACLSLLFILAACSAKTTLTSTPSASNTATTSTTGSATTTSPVQSPTPGTNTPLTGDPFWVEKKGGVGASLSAVMTLAVANQTRAYPTILAIPAVSIKWAGNVFDGQRQESGPVEDVLDQVHGSLSVDGKSFDSFMFSRVITRISSNNGTSFRVTLQNIPIGEQPVGTPPFPGFEMSGADIQNYVVSIDYSEGPLDAGKIVPSTKYVSTDWNNSGPGQKPMLKISIKDVGEALPNTGQ
jgi:hypothetical protein